MKAVFELQISASEKLVLLAMADHAHDDGTSCYPSIETLARKTSQTRRGVQKIMCRLEKSRLIEPSKLSHGRRTTEYRIVLGNREPGSPLAGTQPRTTEHATANRKTRNREPGSPEPLGTVNEPKEPKRDPPCGNRNCEPGSPQRQRQNAPLVPNPPVEMKRKSKPLLPQQQDYLNVQRLIEAAIEMRKKAERLRVVLDAVSWKEDLKCYAAKHGMPYNSDSIAKALEIAELRMSAGTAKRSRPRRHAQHPSPGKVSEETKNNWPKTRSSHGNML